MPRWKKIGHEDTLICEMSNKRKELTQLPMNIWIDESMTYIDGGHSKRIKFQLDKGNKFNKHNCASMDLDGNIQPPNADLGELKSKDIEQVRNFVLNNKYVLEHVADEDIWLDEIWPSMIMGGEPASYEEISKLNLKVDELILKGYTNYESDN